MARYDRRHERARAAAVRAWRPGDACPRCGLEINPAFDDLHLDHDEHGGYLGLSHAGCNTRAGGLKSAARAGKRPRERRCRVCGIPIKPARGRTSATVETCGNLDCVAAWKRRREQPPEPPEPGGRIW